MADQIREAAGSKILANVGAWIGAATGVTVLLLFFNGNLSTQTEVHQLRDDLKDFRTTIVQVQTAIAGGLRPEEVNRHLASQDGRMDAYDARLRQDEERLTRALTLLEEIDAAAKQQMMRGH